MGQRITKTINRFDGGMSDTGRESFETKARLIKHFDIFSDPAKLIPYRDTEADENDGATADGMKQYDVRHFKLGLDGKLYGLGKNGSGYSKVVSKADPTTGNWTLEATAEAAAARVLGCFIEWQDDWYMFTGTNKVSKWTIGGTFTDTVLTLGETITTVADGIVGKDGNLYLAYNNKIVRVNSAGTATDDVCAALPSDMRITSLAYYGSYLAIGMAYGTSATSTPAGVSKVFLWDYNTTTTIQDVIDWGEGALQVLGNVEGALVGVSNKYMEKSVVADDLSVGRGAMVVKRWTGGIPRVIKEIVANQTVTLGRFIQDKVIKDNKLYWVASVPFNTSTSTESTYHLGIWCFGRKNANSDYALTLDYIEDGVDTSNFKINSFGNAGNYWFINHSADGSIEKTNDTASYTTTSTYETDIVNTGLDKGEFVGATILCETQPSAGQLIIKYKVDGSTTWSSAILTDGADSIERASVVNSSAQIPQFKEIEFRLESTGGTVITGFSFVYDIIKDNLYS